MGIPTQVSHDGMARQSIMREKALPGECGWCGHKGRRWAYWIEADDRPNRSLRRAEAFLKAFCSIACWRTYYGD